MKNSAYANANERKRMGGILDYPFNDPDRIAELHAIYYGMVEELDQWIGKILDRLESRPGTAKNTMIVFTSDHGDLMGAHGMVGKSMSRLNGYGLEHFG
jgi:arylsulfatase A-like enzyme